MPARFADAQAARPKLLDISGDTPIVRTVEDAPEMLLDAFLEGIKPPAGDLQRHSRDNKRLRAELAEERATTARLQQEVERLRAAM